jgi:hypothetical protein
MPALPRRTLLAAPFLAACVPEEPPATTTPARESGPMGMVFFSVEFLPGLRAGLPSRSQVMLVEGAANDGPIARTLPGPGVLSGTDWRDDGATGLAYALMLPARPLGLGRIMAEPNTATIMQRTTFILPPLPFTPRPGVALYLGAIALLPHTWQPSRERDIQPPSHRALRDRMARDLAVLRPRMPELAGLPVERAPRAMGWPNELPPRSAWPAGGAAPVQHDGFTTPQGYGAPRAPISPADMSPQRINRPFDAPIPTPGFGPGLTPSRLGRGAAQ